MNALGYSDHAHHRAKNRSISELAVDLVVRFGRVQRHRKANVFSLDRKSRNSIRVHLGQNIYRMVEDMLEIYVVLADNGQIITVGHRAKHLKNDC